mgnify:CR=1 FL=1
MLPSSGRSIGEQSTTVLPSNRSIIVADSRFRGENAVDSPYNFNCDLSGTAIYAKELYYQKLFWNQPVFSHNNNNCELRFQMNGNDAITYVVYATPFVTYHEYDGNPPGTSLLPPQVYSYASNMEIAFNFDVRTIPNNTTPANGVGYLVDPNVPLHKITMCFRYAPARGFCIYPVQDSPTPGYYYSIRLVSCSYIANAHFVHGFGVYDPTNPIVEYVPNGFWATAIWSDVTPNLLPTRYIVIQSQELNKDRRLISFHNGNFASFVNELGIFSINPSRTGVFHEVGVGDDATVISMRDEYTPQTFRIQILNERGEVITCGDPINAILQSNGIDPAYSYSYFNGPFQGRGNPDFINYLVFGYRVMRNGNPLGASGPMNLAASPLGMQNLEVHYQYLNYNSLNVAQYLFIGYTLPLRLSSSSLTGVTPGPLSQGLGFNQYVTVDVPFIPDLPKKFTMFTWYRNLNPFPTIRWDIGFDSISILSAGTAQAYLYFVMFDAVSFQVIMVARVVSINTPPPSPSPITAYGYYVNNWSVNPDYDFPNSPSTIQVGFSAAWVGLSSTFDGHLHAAYAGATPPPTSTDFLIENPNNTPNTQSNAYYPPVTDFSYAFGDPLASALCEEVIHEIAAVLEYN